MAIRKSSKKRKSNIDQARADRVFLIKELMAQGNSQSDIARKMGISRQAINQILSRHK